jgi:hypothetical protein
MRPTAARRSSNVVLPTCRRYDGIDSQQNSEPYALSETLSFSRPAPPAAQYFKCVIPHTSFESDSSSRYSEAFLCCIDMPGKRHGGSNTLIAKIQYQSLGVPT